MTLTCDSCGTALGEVDDGPDSGMLCERCGAAYAGLVAAGALPAGQAPEAAEVDEWHADAMTDRIS